MDRLIIESARKWNFPLRWARLLFYLPPLISLVYLATYFVDPNIVIEFGREDGVLEWLTVACFVAGGIVALGCAVRFFRSRRKVYGWLYVVVFVLALVVAGEEVSWGQRIFGWQTPEAFAVNRQNETNLHNLPKSPFIYAPHAASAYGVVAYLFTAVPLIRARIKREHQVLIPPFFLAAIFAVPLVWFTVRLLTPYTPFASRYNEWCETVLAGGFLAYMLLVRARMTFPTPAPTRYGAKQSAMAELEV